MRTVEDYMRLAWTIVVRFHDEQGGYWSAEVAELPGCTYATKHRPMLLPELDAVLRMTLESMLKEGEEIPIPTAAAAR